MLNKKNTYALLLICLIHLGCLSDQHYKMYSEKDKMSIQSTSKHEGTYYEDQKSDIDLKLEKLLNLGKLIKGFCIDNDDINSVLEKLDMNEYNFDSDNLKDYKDFLNRYGSIFGNGLFICGPTKSFDEKEKKINLMVSIQNAFKNRVSKTVKKLEKKAIWLIAEDEHNKYYIDFSNHGCIYSIGLDSIPKYFSENFSNFLDRIFEYYKAYITKPQEESSSEEEPIEDDLLFGKVNKFLQKNRLELGFAITDLILDSARKKLGMNEIFGLDELKDYKNFLNKYGSISNTTFDIYKCDLNIRDKIKKNNIDKKVDAITSTQILFHRSIKKRGRNEKSFWLIAKHKDTQYCINLAEGSNLGHIYYVDSFGNLTPFAKDFSEFLDKFFDEYEKST
ncbi:MAG: SMI1/KNR4 family protein (plasmid) [Candidatus Cardinium sp.]|nr:MAG: SMI1/KNR4 family protein [Candidatus Cardinium sp.]